MPIPSRANPRSSIRARIGRPVDRGLPQRRREEILVAATRFFAQHGYRNADIEMLAEQLGIGKGTIYRYFRTKEQLFTSVLGRGLAALHEAVAASAVPSAPIREGLRKGATAKGRRVEADGDPEDGLDLIRRAIVAYFGFFDRHPDVVELMVLERAELKGRGKPTYFSHRDRYLGPWRTRLRRLMASGKIRRMDVDIIISCLGMLMYGALVTHPFMSARNGLASHAGDVLDVVLYGICARDGGPGAGNGSEP